MIIQKKAYAKINLYLKILNKLPSGYHNIYTIMQKISLCDDIIININPSDTQNINIICNDKAIPTDKNNTVYKSAELFFERANVSVDIEITIDKKIPSQAGLGGGSSDAGAVLLGLNEYYNFILSETDLIEIAAKIGADVPFFAKNANCAICEGIGEIVTPYYIDLSGLLCLIVKPAYNISTKQAYEDWDRFNKSNKFKNDFTALAFSQNNNLKMIRDLILDSGASESELSGSGSALFGIFDNPENAEKCQKIINQQNDIEFCNIFKFLC